MFIFSNRLLPVITIVCLVSNSQSLLQDGTTQRVKEEGQGLPGGINGMEKLGNCKASCDEHHGTCVSLQNFNKKFDDMMRLDVAQNSRRRNIGVYEGNRVCSCDSGYLGPSCSKECRGGHGPYCYKPCPSNCDGDCDTKTGGCTAGCKAGFTGADCVNKEDDERPTVEVFRKHEGVILGSKVQFMCKANGSPKPNLKFIRGPSFMRMNQKATFYDDVSTLEPNSTLRAGMFIIPKAFPNDAGTYKCVATNRAGTAEAKATLRVVLYPEPPTIEVRPSKISIKVGDDVQFTANITGIPFPLLKTEHFDMNGMRSPLLKGTLLKDEKYLTIRNATLDDAGTYIFKAWNKAGGVTATVNVIIGNRTQPPRPPCIDCIKRQCAKHDSAIKAKLQMTGAQGFQGSSNVSGNIHPEIENLAVKREYLRLRNLSLEMQNELIDTILQRNTLSDANLELSKVLIICAVVGAMYLVYLGKIIFDLSKKLRKSRNANRDIEFEVTSTFPSTMAGDLDVKSIYKELLEDFSDTFESKVQPGAKIRKSSIIVSPVTAVKQDSVINENSKIQRFVLYGGLGLIGLLLMCVILLYSLKTRKRRQITKLSKHNRFTKPKEKNLRQLYF